LSTSRKTPRQMGVRVSSSLDALQQELGESFLCPRIDHAVDRVLLGLTSKAVSLARAICHLVRGGYYAEAFGLSRSSLETFLLAKFISNKKPEERAQSYLDFFKAHYFNREEVRKKYFPRSKAPSGIQKQWIEDASKFPGGTKGWQSAWNMASEILQDPREYNKKTGEPYQALFEFDAMYEHMSHFVHCTSLSTAPHVPRGGEVFKLVDGRIDDPDRGHAALIFAVGYLQMTCHFGSSPVQPRFVRPLGQAADKIAVGDPDANNPLKNKSEETKNGVCIQPKICEEELGAKYPAPV
jgi:hypothetical protein